MATIHFGHMEQTLSPDLYPCDFYYMEAFFSDKVSIPNLKQLIALSCLCTVLMMHMGEQH